MRRDHHPQPHARQANSSHDRPQAPRTTPAQATPARAASPPPVASAEDDTRDPRPAAPDAPAPLLLTPAEAARALRINRSTLYPLLMRGEIPSIRIGRARRIPRDGLMRWIAQQVNEQQVSEQRVHDDGSA